MGRAVLNDMLKSIEPKSDQLNADDLIGGRSITVKITKVSFLAGDQPFGFYYEGDNGKPYKPCKSMRRVIVTAWGSNANLYVGRSMRLYRDEKVKFGGDIVGGIRISHMSGIDSDMTMALTVSRANRKPYTVKPLANETTKAEGIPLSVQGNEAAEQGIDALRAFWNTLSPAQKAEAGGQPQLESWKRTAAAAKERPI